MVPKNDKWKNIVLLLIELPIVGFLALFTLDEYSSILAYKEHPWSIFMQRLIFASAPILIVEILMFLFINLIFMSLSKKEIYKGVVTKSFFIKHILYLLLMVIIRKTKCSRSAKRNDIFAKRNVYVFSSF